MSVIGRSQAGTPERQPSPREDQKGVIRLVCRAVMPIAGARGYHIVMFLEHDGRDGSLRMDVPDDQAKGFSVGQVFELMAADP